MSVLILHRNPFEPFPYQRWLADYDGDVVVVAARDRIELFAEPVPVDDAGYARLEILDRFDDAVLRERGLALAAEFGVTHVVAHHEADVDTAAWLRERLGLPGAWPADVLPFRDKALMKRLAGDAGIDVAAHLVTDAGGDVTAFADRRGYPLVAKNRAGYNAIDLRILRDPRELEEFLAGPFRAAPPGQTLIEQFVPGRMCHVDGLVVGGRTVLAWPSQYQYDLASFGTDPGPRIDLTLDRDDPLTTRLLDLAERTLAALRPAGGRLRDHAFHLEVFHTPDDRLVLCEIASRPGGAKIREVFETMFGINLGEYATRAQLGLALPALASQLRGGPLPAPERMSGQVLMMKRPGLVRAVPVRPAEEWVERFWRYGEPGEVIPPASGSSDFLLAAVGSAATRVECEHRLRELGARFAAQTEIVTREAGVAAGAGAAR